MRHARLERLNVQNNQLMVAGRPISDYIGSQKPHYIYSRDEIATRIASLRSTLPTALKLHYAIKANPMKPLLAFISPLVDGLDVASKGELIKAQQVGNQKPISFAGPAKQVDELLLAIGAGVVINVESERELLRIVDIAKQQGVVAKIALRVNPDFELKQSGMQMAGGPKAFGIDAENIPAVIEQLDTVHVALVGFHIFAGSQNLSHESLIAAHEQTFTLAAALVACCVQAGKADQLQHVNIGGGFGIPYFPGQQDLMLEPIAEALQQRLDERTGVFATLDIVLELGRYMVGEAGYYVCQISDIKTSREKTFLMVNGGLHHHLSNSGNFGQILRKNYPTVLADKLYAEHTYGYEIAGPLCTPLDIVAANIDLPQAEVGDYVVVLQSGAYGYTASPLNFLGHEPPVELLV